MPYLRVTNQKIFVRTCYAILFLGIGLGGGRLSVYSQPLLPPVTPDSDQLSMQLKVTLNGLRFEGNKVFSSTRLLEVAARSLAGDDEVKAAVISGHLFQDKLAMKVSSDELERIRLAVTKLYVDGGHINSGAILPEQSVQGGIIRYRIIEGRLTQLNIRNDTGKEEGGSSTDDEDIGLKVPQVPRLPEDYIRARIELDMEGALNVNHLQERLEIIRQNPLLRQINAQLTPGVELGESILDVSYRESNPFHLGLRIDNRRAPSVGAERLVAFGSHNNLTGQADSLAVEWGITNGGINDLEFAGIDDMSVSYAIPVTIHDTIFSIQYSRSSTLLVEEPFASLNIESDSERFGITLRHPLMRTPTSELAASISLGVGHNETFLLGFPFSFDEGARNGVTDVTVLRLGVDYSNRSQDSALALRSTFNIGLDLFGSTNHGSEIPDSQFLAWQGQAQYIQRIGKTENQLVAAFTTQLSNDPLLSLEQFSVGGFDTVRGYRENTLVRDNGVVLSLEARIPILFDSRTGHSIITLAPFFDFGYAWNHNSRGTDGQDIASIGIGLIVIPNETFRFQIYYGYALRDFDTSGDLQDAGLHFEFVVLPF